MPPSGTTLRAHGIEDEGTPLGQKPKLNFVGGGVSVANVGTKTVVTIPGGGPDGVFDLQDGADLTGTPADGKGWVKSGAGMAWTDLATQTELDAHLNDAADAHAASAVSFTPTGTVTAIHVQGAIAAVAATVEDLIVGVSPFANVNNYGAVQGDAASATTNTAAVNAAIDALQSGGGVCNLYFPEGRTKLNGGIVAEDKIHWHGAGGKNESELYFPTDTAFGTWAVVHNTVANTYAPSFTNLHFKGPGTGFVAGVAPCNMRGLKLAYKNVMTSCHVTDFYAGVTLYGDHNLFVDVNFETNFWGVEFPESGALSHGDQNFYYCMFAGNNLCGVHCAGEGRLDHVYFLGAHFGFGPFGILRELTAAGGNASACFMLNTKLQNCAFEYIGNSAIADFGNNDSWRNCEIDGSGWTNAGAPFYDSSRPRAYAIHLPGLCAAGEIKNDFYPYTLPTSGTAVYNIGGSGFPVYGGGLQQKMFAQAGRVWFDNTTLHLTRTATGTVAVGDLVEYLADGTVQRATGTPATKILVGVAVTSTATAPIIMTRFNAPLAGFAVNSETVGAVTKLAQKTGSYHIVGPAASYPENPEIGYSIGAGGNAGGTATVSALLRLP